MVKIDDITSWKAWKEALWTHSKAPVDCYITTQKKLKSQTFGLRSSPKDGQPIVPDPYIENVWLERDDFYWNAGNQSWSDTTQKIYIFK